MAIPTEKKSLIKLLAVTFLVSVVFSSIAYALNHLYLRGILGITETIAFSLIYNIIAILIYTGQQKPKTEKVEERRLLRKVLLWAFLCPLGTIVNLFLAVRFWNSLLSAILITSFSLTSFAIYPLILNGFRKHYISTGDKTKQGIINKCLITFFVVTALALILHLRHS